MAKMPPVDHQHARDAAAIIIAIGMDRAQRNERTALALLALAGVGAAQTWSEAAAKTLGIQGIMDAISKEYGRTYKTGSREAIRKYSVKQMVDAGFAQQNAAGARPTNDGRTSYTLTDEFVTLLRSYGSAAWPGALAVFNGVRAKLRRSNTRTRRKRSLPVKIRLADGETTVYLSPGGQNLIIKAVLEDFGPIFTPDAIVAYIGDAGGKHDVHDRPLLAKHGITTDDHGKMPDIILIYEKEPGQKPWLVLVEAASTAGVMDPMRVRELTALFAGCDLDPVFITAFADRPSMFKLGKTVSWETEVWIASDPDHLIHYNGDRFLGPHTPPA